MALLLILIQIHAVSLVVCGVALRWQFLQSAEAVIDKSSQRMDGSISQRRKCIELVSISHAFGQVYYGLVFLFFATALCGLSTAELKLPPPTFDAELDSAANAATPTLLSRAYPWPLVAVYAVSTFIVMPQLMMTLYRRATKRYVAHAAFRFREYTNSDWMEMKELEAENEACTIT